MPVIQQKRRLEVSPTVFRLLFLYDKQLALSFNALPGLKEATLQAVIEVYPLIIILP